MPSLIDAPAVQSIDLPTGVTLEYVEQGAPSGVPVVLLHGVTDSWRSFEPVLPFLPASIRAFSLSQRGHGASDRPSAGYLFSDFALDVAAFLDALGIEQAVVVGHSMGSSVAQRFAIDYPERTLGLTLLGAFASFRDNPAIVEYRESTIAGLQDPVTAEVAREFQESTLARPVPPAFLEMVVGESLKVPARVWRSAFEGFVRADFPEELGKIAAPTLIIWGDQDAFCPRRDQDVLTEAISDSQLLVYPGAGHASHWEEPERVAADLVAFVREIVGA